MGNWRRVVGVLPRNFVFAPEAVGGIMDFARLAGFALRRNGYWLHPVARLKPGSACSRRKQRYRLCRSRLAMQYPDSNAGVSTESVDLRRQIVGQVQPVLVVLMAAIGFVLLITCANVAGLLLARSLPRKKEISIRLALGARTNRIARQLLTESILLALIGGGAGVLAAYWAVPAIISVLPQDILLSTPQLQGLTVNAEALWFALGVSLLTGILFGLAPLRSDFQSQPATRASGGGPRIGRLRTPPAQCAGDFGNGVGGGSAGRRGTDAQEFAPRAGAPIPVSTLAICLPAWCRCRETNIPMVPNSWLFSSSCWSRIRSLPGVQEAGGGDDCADVRQRQYLPLRPGRTSQEQRRPGIRSQYSHGLTKLLLS